ncbi:MAG: hypothetical protein ABI824_18045 [Acidobacteriota bacterium]
MQYPKAISAITMGSRFVFALTLASASLSAQHLFEKPPATQPVDIAPGVNFPQVVHNVADLDRSIKWYTDIHFRLAQPPTPWTVDEALNTLANTPGAESRTAILKVQGFGGTPLTLVLRQYRGIPQQNWSKREPSEASATARSNRDAKLFLEDLGLIPLSATGGPVLPAGTYIRTARMEDLDGFGFDAVATDQGLEVRDSAETPAFTPQTAKIQDINTNYASFRVSDINAAYASAKENGATTVTNGGIVNYNNGRAVLVRDPYANSFILLWQPAS